MKRRHGSERLEPTAAGAEEAILIGHGGHQISGKPLRVNVLRLGSEKIEGPVPRDAAWDGGPLRENATGQGSIGGEDRLPLGMSKAKAITPTSFSFVDNERTYTCTREGLRGVQDDPWWWFSVSSDDRHRYAPFRAEVGDTEASVRPRVVAYYEDLLARRAAPPEPRWRGRGNQGSGPKPAAAPAKPE
ncbi:MAG: hypothetical protein AMXMBFR55_02630 [Gemmatimonadota bacterium]